MTDQTFVEPVAPEQLANVLDLPSVFQMDQNVEWLVDGMIVECSVNLLTSESGSGKTWLSYGIAGAVAHGTSFVGRDVQQRPVLYVDGENPLFNVKDKLKNLGIQDTRHLNIWGGWNDLSPEGPESKLVLSFAREYRGLIIYDSLVEFHSGDEQSSSQTRAFMKHFRALAHAGATVLILHHTGKGRSSAEYRGSSDIKAAVDTAYFLKKVSERDGKLDKLALKTFKSRLAPGQDFGVQFKAGEGFTSCEVEAASGPSTLETVIHKIIADNPGINGKGIREKAQVQGLAKNKVETCLQFGPWKRMSGKGSELLYFYPDGPEEEPGSEFPIS